MSRDRWGDAPPGKTGRIVLAACGILVVEALRSQLHPESYVGDWQRRALAGSLINFALQIWTLPDTGPKAVTAAAVGQLGAWFLGGLFNELAYGSVGLAWQFYYLVRGVLFKATG